MATDSAIDGGLVREFNSGSESRSVRGIDIRGDVRGGQDGVIAGDVNRLDEGVEVASRNVVGVVPVDHASGPINGTLRGSWDTSRPHTGVGHDISFALTERSRRGFHLIWIRAGVDG